MAYMQKTRNPNVRKAELSAGESPKSAPVSNSLLQAGLWDRGYKSFENEEDPEPGSEGGVLGAGSEAAGWIAASSAHRLDSGVNVRIGGMLGADFSGVRIHTDEAAQRAADSMNARAFTKGKDIYFNEGEYDPGSSSGQRLLAHELTHTIQQGQVAQTAGSGKNTGEEKDTMAYAQTARRSQAQKALLSHGLQAAPGKASSVISNSVMQAKLQIGGSRTPAETEADSVASKVMSQDGVLEPIPVTQSVSMPGSAQEPVQRDFFGVKRRYRKAVDQLNDGFEDYKKQSLWKRFKWTMANPIARMTARTKKNRENTDRRLLREMAIERMAMDAQAENSEGTRTSIDTSGMSTDDLYSVLDRRAEGGPSKEAPQEMDQDHILGLAGTGVGLLGNIKKLGGPAEKIGELAAATGAALNMAGSVGQEKTDMLKEQEAGDSSGTAQHILRSAASVTSGAGGILGNLHANVAPALGIASDIMQGMASVSEIIHANDVQKRSGEAEGTAEGTAGQRLFHKVGRQAQNKKAAAGWDLSKSAVDLAANVSAIVAPATGAKTVLSGLGAAIGFGKNFFMGRRRKAMIKEEVRRDLGMDGDKIDSIRKSYSVDGKALSKKEAEKFLLFKDLGARSYEEAYMRLVEQQKEEAGTADRRKLLEVLGMERVYGAKAQQAQDEQINQWLGYTQEAAANPDEWIDKLNKRKKRNVFSDRSRGLGAVMRRLSGQSGQ